MDSRNWKFLPKALRLLIALPDTPKAAQLGRRPSLAELSLAL